MDLLFRTTGLDVNAEITKYVYLSHHLQSAGQLTQRHENFIDEEMRVN
jgi:hypothetical protein